MPNEEEPHNPKYVTAAMCKRQIENFRAEIKDLKSSQEKVERALIGEDMQGGLVKEVADIKATLKTGSTAMNWIKPVVIAIVTTAVTIGLYHVFGH